ncbi:hypothetical protein Cgig2_006922 [Carnegiea gigantea]|uniref:Uncharacterized protein n=1 Tax=Carnegiea gigantea TaxID=171969 RepID=A0A9Q1GIP8_9CARY|nr:hypothetical protein Cgig2_006922 [Carnegiea gigantea]
MHATLGVPLRGTKIIEITKSSMDDEHDEVHSTWLMEWKLQKNARNSLECPSSFCPKKMRVRASRGTLSYTCGLKNLYCSKSILKYLKDVSQIPSLDWCQFVVDKLITSVRHYKEMNNDFYAPSFIPAVPLDKPDGNGQIQADKSVSNASIIVEKEEHREDVVLDQPNSVIKEDRSMPSYSLGLGLSQLDSQSPVPQNTSMPDSSTIAVNEDDGNEDDDDGDPSRFTLRNTSQVNCVLSVKKLVEKKRKEGDEPASKKSEVRKQSIKSKRKPYKSRQLAQKYRLLTIPKSQQDKANKHSQTAGEKGKLKNVGSLDAVKKQQPQNLPSTYCSSYVIGLTKLNSELSQDELTISEYVFGKVEDVDDSEPLFDSCGNKVATRASMVTLRLGEQLEVNVINIWSNILNDRKRKRDLASPSRLFMSCDQSISASRSTYYSIITASVIITKTLSF